MRIYFDIGARETEALKQFAVKRFYQLDERTCSAAARLALIEYLIAEGVLDGDLLQIEIADQAAAAQQPRTLPQPVVEVKIDPQPIGPNNIVLTPAPASAPAPAPTKKEKPVEREESAALRELAVPQRTFKSKVSNTWITWSWMVRLCMGEGDVRWPAVSTAAGANELGMTNKEIGQALYTLVGRGWLRRTKKGDYTFTDKARSWLQENRKFLVDNEVITAL